MFPLPMQHIGYSAKVTSQSYKINSGKEYIIEEKDKICYLSRYTAHSLSQYHLRHCILEKVMKCCLYN